MEPEELLDKIKRRQFTVGVMGLGRVGLPLALAFAARGIRTVGLDVDEKRLADIQRGTMPFIELGADDVLAGLKGSDVFRVSSEYTIMREADAIFITVGTALNSDLRPDYSQLHAALSGLAGVLRPVQILMQRSTVAPGTLSRYVKPYMEGTLGLRVGKDILLASTPERIASGFALTELPALPEIVGGIDEMSSRVAVEVLRCLNPDKKLFVTSSTGAELSKLFTNVYRYVTFALANEFALLAEMHGEDARELIRIANSDYPRGGIPRPGPCGGPCLTKDGYFLVEDLTFPDFILTAWKLNEGVPAHMLRRLKAHLAMRGKNLEDARVCVLGMGFKAESDDLRQSPALRMIDLLKSQGADVIVSDPFFDTPAVREAVTGVDAIVLATNHSSFKDLGFLGAVNDANPRPILVDCWGEWDEETIRAAGFELISFGKGNGL